MITWIVSVAPDQDLLDSISTRFAYGVKVLARFGSRSVNVRVKSGRRQRPDAYKNKSDAGGNFQR
jgi:hypothetical protein